LPTATRLFLCVFNFFHPALLSNLNAVPRHIPITKSPECRRAVAGGASRVPGGPVTSGAPSNAKELSAMDIIVLAIGVVSFALFLAYVTACDSL
jgi:hypothetical protein